MKLIFILVALSLTGCASYKKVPPVGFEEWTHALSIGPYQSRIVATGAAKLPDGSVHVDKYSGQVNFLGYGVTDEIKGLKIEASAK